MHTSYRGIAFLLSLGSLPLACTKDDGDGDGDSTSAAPTTGGATDPGQTTGTSDPTTGATDSTAPTSSTTAPTTSTTSTTDPDPGLITDGPPPDSDPVCVTYSRRLAECNPQTIRSYDDNVTYCSYYKSYGKGADGQACADALDANYVCLSQLDCEELLNEASTACDAEGQAVVTACPTLFESGETTDTDTDTGADTGSSGG